MYPERHKGDHLVIVNGYVYRWANVTGHDTVRLSEEAEAE